jgi:hypothetical protein
MPLNELGIEELTVALQIIGRIIDTYEKIPGHCKHRFLAGGEVPQTSEALRNVAAKLVAKVIATGDF